MRLFNNSLFEWNKTFQGLNNSLGITNALNIAMAETSARYMNRFVPMQSGVLSQTYETGQDSLGGFVRYVSPYAHYQYNGEGFNFSKEQHPLATDHWDKYMMQIDGFRLTEEMNQLRKRFAR